MGFRSPAHALYEGYLGAQAHNLQRDTLDADIAKTKAAAAASRAGAQADADKQLTKDIADAGALVQAQTPSSRNQTNDALATYHGIHGDRWPRSLWAEMNETQVQAASPVAAGAIPARQTAASMYQEPWAADTGTFARPSLPSSRMRPPLSLPAAQGQSQAVRPATGPGLFSPAPAPAPARAPVAPPVAAAAPAPEPAPAPAVVDPVTAMRSAGFGSPTAQASYMESQQKVADQEVGRAADQDLYTMLATDYGRNKEPDPNIAHRAMMNLPQLNLALQVMHGHWTGQGMSEALADSKVQDIWARAVKLNEDDAAEGTKAVTAARLALDQAQLDETYRKAVDSHAIAKFGGQLVNGQIDFSAIVDPNKVRRANYFMMLAYDMLLKGATATEAIAQVTNDLTGVYEISDAQALIGASAEELAYLESPIIKGVNVRNGGQPQAGATGGVGAVEGASGFPAQDLFGENTTMHYDATKGDYIFVTPMGDGSVEYNRLSRADVSSYLASEKNGEFGPTDYVTPRAEATEAERMRRRMDWLSQRKARSGGAQ